MLFQYSLKEMVWCCACFWTHELDLSLSSINNANTWLEGEAPRREKNIKYLLTAKYVLSPMKGILYKLELQFPALEHALHFLAQCEVNAAGLQGPQRRLVPILPFLVTSHLFIMHSLVLKYFLSYLIWSINHPRRYADIIKTILQTWKKNPKI